MVVGGRLYQVPCTECQRVIGWIMFSLHYFFPSTCIAISYGYTGYKLCMYECMHMYVNGVTCAGDQQLRRCNSPQQLRGCISGGHRRRCACMRVYVCTVQRG